MCVTWLNPATARSPRPSLLLQSSHAIPIPNQAETVLFKPQRSTTPYTPLPNLEAQKTWFFLAELANKTWHPSSSFPKPRWDDQISDFLWTIVYFMERQKQVFNGCDVQQIFWGDCGLLILEASALRSTSGFPMELSWNWTVSWKRADLEQ